jgi:hypothetical protein
VSDLGAFGDPNLDRLTAVVFELASQLHVERQRRMALETVLTRAGAIEPTTLAALADDPAFLASARAELDAALRRLLRPLTEDGDARGPLRAETPGD